MGEMADWVIENELDFEAQFPGDAADARECEAKRQRRNARRRELRRQRKREQQREQGEG